MRIWRNEVFSRRTLYNIDESTQARLRCIVARSGTKLEMTSLKYKSTFSGLRHHSTCFWFVYIVQLDIENEIFANIWLIPS